MPAQSAEYLELSPLYSRCKGAGRSFPRMGAGNIMVLIVRWCLPDFQGKDAAFMTSFPPKAAGFDRDFVRGIISSAEGC